MVGWVDLTAPGVTDVVAGLRELPGGDRLAAIRHPVLIEPDPDWLARPAVLRGLAAVAAAGLAYDVVGEPRHLPAAADAAGRLPQLTFVLDHLGNPGLAASPRASEPWASAFARLAALPNVVVKLSGILSEPPPPGAGPVVAPAAVLRHRAGRVRAGPAHVRLGLAGLHAGRQLRARSAPRHGR